MNTRSLSAPGEATREQILVTAERLFREIGYQKTTVADIARALRMSPANVYRFFASKSAINEGCAARLLGGIADGAWAIARSPRPAPERLRGLAQHLHESSQSLLLGERRMHDMVEAAMAEHWGVVRRWMGEVQGAIRHVIADGIASGSFRGIEAEAGARMFKQALVPWTHPVLLANCFATGGTEAQLAAEREEMVGFLLRALGAQE
jgi:AcrR family transcriptional regulator